MSAKPVESRHLPRAPFARSALAPGVRRPLALRLRRHRDAALRVLRKPVRDRARHRSWRRPSRPSSRRPRCRRCGARAAAGRLHAGSARRRREDGPARGRARTTARLESAASRRRDRSRPPRTRDLAARGRIVPARPRRTLVVGPARDPRPGAGTGRVPNLVRVEGHTDDVPIRTPQFVVELGSVRRARDARRAVADRTRADWIPTRLSAAGYARAPAAAAQHDGRRARPQSPRRHRGARTRNGDRGPEADVPDAARHGHDDASRPRRSTR